ncbi:MAG: CBS domain-containing protein [Alphaproteobacteria bacterium]|nr:CBS domain-containing protein [Alphaproteobacteria bacterium]
MNCGWSCSTSGGRIVSISTTSLTVGQVQLLPSQIPKVGERTLLKEALEAMSRKRLGIVCIVSSDERLVGVFTDGDVRRMLLKDQRPFAALFADDVIVHANRKPTTTSPETPLVEAIRVMEDKQVWDLPVVGRDGRLTGLLHLHPAVKQLLSLSP